MDNLIPVNYETDQPCVSARDLHEKLNIKTAFKDWFPRMCEYGFEEGKDFCSKMSERHWNNSREYKVYIKKLNENKNLNFYDENFSIKLEDIFKTIKF